MIDPKNNVASPASPPVSATVVWINLVALLSLGIAIFALRTLHITDRAVLVWTVMVSIALPVVVLERIVLGNRLGKPKPANLAGAPKRCAIKLVGLVASFAVMTFFYWLFPYFRNGDALLVYEILSFVGVGLIIIAPFYVWFVDQRMDEPEDEYFMAGLAAIGRWDEINSDLFWQHCRSWLIKIFFFQYITSVLIPYVLWAINLDVIHEVTSSQFGVMNVFIDGVWLVDVAFSCTGYFLTLRLFNSHVRSADPNLAGWVACMLCYGPFYVMLITSFLPYEDNYYWGHWLQNYPVIKMLWAVPIILLLGNSAAASVQFGIRFSNLTHRGIITSGPFRFTKHPQYISKNVAWWFISIPFINQAGWAEGLRHCILLLGFNLVFYFRAITEERHLSADPDYRAYAAWIAQHGIFAKLYHLLWGKQKS